MKLSNKVISALRLPSKYSFTPSKLRFFGLRKPWNPSCYTTSNKKGVSKNLLGTPFFWLGANLFLRSLQHSLHFAIRE